MNMDEGTDDSEHEVPLKKKKKKIYHKSTFQSAWPKMWPCIKKAESKPNHFFCTICLRNVSCGHQGRRDVVRHLKTVLHMNLSKCDPLQREQHFQETRAGYRKRKVASPTMEVDKVRIPPPLELLKPISVPKKLLLGAGPANASQRICDTASLPMIGHLHPEFLQLMSETRAGIQYAFQTRNEYTFAISGTGHAAMEAALCNLLEPRDSIAIVVNGAWGERAADMSERCGAEVHKINVIPGMVATLDIIEQALEDHSPSVLFVCHGDSSTGVVHPLEGLGEICQRHNCLLLVDCVASLGGTPLFMDNLEIDVLYSGSQKVLNAPPGISPISFSNRAMTKIRFRNVKVQSYYFDALLLGNYWGCDELPPRYHHTGPISLVYALREALSILAEKTLEVSWENHAQNANLLHKGLLKMGLNPLVENPDHRLTTITTVLVPEGVSDQQVAEYCAKKFSLELARGLPPLAGKVWRIGLMGINSCPKNVNFVLRALEEAIKNTSQVKIEAKY